METDKYIQVADGHFVTAKQTVQSQVEMIDNNGKPLIAAFYSVLLAPDLYDGLFPLLCY